MYIILVYDVNKKRVSKILRICRRYLIRVQNSVFEGYITCGKLKRLKEELQKNINTSQDNIKIHELGSLKYISKEELGKSLNNSKFI